MFFCWFQIEVGPVVSISKGGPTPTNMDHCQLCGIMLPLQKRRYQDTSELHALIKEKCKATPFIYSSIMNYKDPKSPICIPCVNWRRRVTKEGFKRSRRPLVQMDQLILYIMHPGANKELDQRCMGRLFEAIQQPDNPYRSCLPLPVVTILGGIQAITYNEVVKKWWEYNGCTEFFKSRNASKTVRAMLKAERDQAPDDDE